jgi:hypothetical protein
MPATAPASADAGTSTSPTRGAKKGASGAEGPGRGQAKPRRSRRGVVIVADVAAFAVGGLLASRALQRWSEETRATEAGDFLASRGFDRSKLSFGSAGYEEHLPDGRTAVSCIYFLKGGVLDHQGQPINGSVCRLNGKNIVFDGKRVYTSSPAR